MKKQPKAKSKSSTRPPKGDVEGLASLLVDSAREGIVVLDAAGKVVFWNPCAEAIFGRRAKEVEGKSFAAIFPVKMQEELTGYIGRARTRAERHLHLSLPLSQTRTVDLCLCSAPLEGDVKGRVVLFLRDGCSKIQEVERLTEQNLQLNETVGRLGVAHAELQETTRELEILTIFDELTKLYNRRYFFHRARSEFARALRYKQPLGLLFLDFDHFKLVNDELGHPFGDAVLRDAGMLVLGSIRTVDIAARYGGEEFAILAPSTPAKGLQILAERIRTTFEEHVFVHERSSRRVTVSIGGCAVPPYRFADLDEMLRRADEMLYRAKETRNRVECEQVKDE